MCFYKNTLEIWDTHVKCGFIHFSILYKSEQPRLQILFTTIERGEKRIFIKIEQWGYERRRVIAKCP